MQRMLGIGWAILLTAIHGAVLPAHIALAHGVGDHGDAGFVHAHGPADHPAGQADHEHEAGYPVLADASDFGDPHHHDSHDHSVSDHRIVLTRTGTHAPVIALPALAAETLPIVLPAAEGAADRIEAPPPRKPCHSPYSLRGPPIA